MTTAMAVLGAVVVTAGAAFACTAFKGHMWVNKGLATEGHAIGNGTGMQFCPGTTATRGAVTRGISFSAEVAPTSASDPCPNQSLGSSNGPGFDVLYQLESVSTHCMSGVGVDIGNMKITSGTGSGSYTIPTGAGTGNAHVCVAPKTNSVGMMVPVSIL